MKHAPAWLTAILERAPKWAGIRWGGGSDRKFGDDQRRHYPELRGAEAWSSKVEDERGPYCVVRNKMEVMGYEAQHIVALDIDVRTALIPSSSPGHYHLVFDRQVSWSVYTNLLRAMAEAGLVEWGYYDAAISRGETFLRLPWIKKGFEQGDAKAALSEWLDADDRPECLQTPEAVEAYLAEVDPPTLPF